MRAVTRPWTEPSPIDGELARVQQLIVVHHHRRDHEQHEIYVFNLAGEVHRLAPA